jgi:beta-phosphoglucomutase-like phosphatase (HAD superfamily)
MIRTLIFDLSEVFVSGLIGTEFVLADRLGCSADSVVAAFFDEHLYRLCRDEIDEDAFLAESRRRGGWNIGIDELKRLIRANFHKSVEGTEALFDELRGRYETVLLSDHGREWVATIRALHPFLERFDRLFFSFDLGATKREPETFRTVLSLLGREPAECVFIDDNAGNVAVARSVGVPSIQFESADALRRDLDAMQRED